MLLKISTNSQDKKDQDVEVIFDTNGNMYFLLYNKLYDFNITNKNTLEVGQIVELSIEEISKLFTEPSLKGSLKLANKEGSLKGRIIREKQKEVLEDQPENNSESEDEDENHDKYFYEDVTYFEDYDAKDDPDEHVHFLGTDMRYIEFDSCVSLYDTIIYGGDTQSGDPAFKTKLENIEPIYRLKVYKYGDVMFRPVGSAEQSYKLTIVDENIILSPK